MAGSSSTGYSVRRWRRNLVSPSPAISSRRLLRRTTCSSSGRYRLALCSSRKPALQRTSHTSSSCGRLNWPDSSLCCARSSIPLPPFGYPGPRSPPRSPPTSPRTLSENSRFQSASWTSRSARSRKSGLGSSLSSARRYAENASRAPAAGSPPPKSAVPETIPRTHRRLPGATG